MKYCVVKSTFYIYLIFLTAKIEEKTVQTRRNSFSLEVKM